MYDPFWSLFSAFAAFQIILGIAWLLVLIAAARSVDKREKDKWMAEGVERAIRRSQLEEHQLQDLPPYQT